MKKTNLEKTLMEELNALLPVEQLLKDWEEAKKKEVMSF